MISEPALILIDEFGNTHLNLSKGGTFSHFVYSSIIIPLSRKDQALGILKQISKNHFFNNAIKSSNLGPAKFDRRLRALKELLDGLDFTIDVLAIDKSKLENAQGLKYKPIFYKYFQNLFVSKYRQRYRSFEIIADQVGEDFKYELQQYVRAKGIQTDLFNPERAFYIKEDINEEPLLQLADFISGCVGKVICSSHAEVRASELLDLFHSRTSLTYFPYNQEIYISSDSSNNIDSQVADVTLKLIQDFYTTNSSNNEYGRLLDFLLLNNRINSQRLVSTYEIVNYLSQFFSDINEEKVRLLVRDLRYEGLFIISHSGKSGYKVAANYYDIEEYFKHFSKYVIPMLRKIKIFNQAIAENTFNEINPLEKDSSFAQLKGLLAAIN